MGEWRDWLQQHHRDSPGIWLTTYKKAAGDRYVSYEEIVQTALCFGWIDSRPRKLDELRTQLLLTPRAPSSAWSAANKARIEALNRAGLLAESGRAAVQVAQANGAWDILNEVEQPTVPPDLSAALDATPPARTEWEQFPPSTRRGILEWIGAAKKPETRAKRIAETATKAAVGMRANQWRQPKRSK